MLMKWGVANFSVGLTVCASRRDITHRAVNTYKISRLEIALDVWGVLLNLKKKQTKNNQANKQTNKLRFHLNNTRESTVVKNVSTGNKSLDKY